MVLKFICLCCVTAYIIAAPLKDEVSVQRQQPTVIPIISLSAEYVADGKFKYNYETGNGIKREETAYDKESPEGKSHSDCSNEGGEDDDSGEIHVQKGSYSYTAPDGTLVSVRYIADENGFQPIITEVSHNGSPLSSDLSQNIRRIDHGKIAKDKTTDHFETEHENNSNEQTTPTSKNIEAKQKDLEDKIPLKFGDKLKKSEKLIKEEPLKRNHSHDEEKVVNAETPNKESQNSTNNLIPIDKKDRNKTDSIIHEEPLSTVEKSASKKRKPNTNEQISDTKKVIPSKVENKMTDEENKEHVPDNDNIKTKNATNKPSKNEDESKKNDKASYHGKEMSDNMKPNVKIAESDKVKEDLAPKEETSFKAENANDKQKNTTDKNKKANPEAQTKQLETEKNTTKLPEAVVEPQENEANHTNSKINTEKKSQHELNIPEKQNKTSEHTEAVNTSGEYGSKNVSNTPKNKNADNLHDLRNNKMENSQETKKTEKKPSKSEIEFAKNKNALDSKDLLPEKKKNQPLLENASSSLKVEKSLDNSKKNESSPSPKADGLKNNKSDTSDSIKMKPYKENKELPKEEIKIANETNKLEKKNKILNYTGGMSEREIKKPHEYENVSVESEQAPVKSRIQSSENKEKKNEMTERNPDDIVKKTDEEENKRNEDQKNNQNRKETLVNSTDNLANKNNSDGVPHNLEEKTPKLEKQMINNNNISNIKETNEDMTKNLVSKKDKSSPKSSEHQIIPAEEATRDKKEKLAKKNPSKEMEENKIPPNKEENNILKKNETLKNGESVTNNTEKTASPTELLNGSLTKDILKEVQKPVKEAERHEKVAEKAAKKAVKAAEVAENAADTAQKAAEDTEAIIKTLNQRGNQSRELAISAAIKHAKLAGDAAKEAVKAAEMAEIAADNAKNAAQAAEKVVELVQSSSNKKHYKELISKAGDAVKNAIKSANDAVHAAKDATKQSESLPETDPKNIDANIKSNI
ncbi:unnamed protein product [Arctia plantaginis]|uniref:Uncharacterized protein n=1 Tax=Arctia plantaginis TaxID=874455 RepID=A0A8S0YSC4_ARCPL|nr:unnamed protein product [Arctia plantaginis]